MKNLRKLFTLALVLIMLVSVLVLPAMAATVEHDHDHECEAASEIQPRYPLGPCYYCSSDTTYYGMQSINGVLHVIGKCTSCGRLSFFPYD